jgi:hypothetical protein
MARTHTTLDLDRDLLRDAAEALGSPARLDLSLATSRRDPATAWPTRFSPSRG